MPRLLSYLTAGIGAVYSEAAVSKVGAGLSSPEDLEEWFFLATIAGDVHCRALERLLNSDMLVLIAIGSTDDAIDSR